MIESPLIEEVFDQLFGEKLRKAKQDAKQEAMHKAKQEAMQEAKEEAMQEAIQVVLQTRFNSVPQEIEQRLRAVRALRTLNALTKHAAVCRDLEAFRKRLLK